MNKEISILGENLQIRFNMAVELAYEEITQKPFSLKDLDYQKNSTALYMAAIITNNPDTKITYDRLIKEASADEIGAIAEAVIECMTDFLHIPGVIPDEKQSEESPKN